MPKGFFLPKPKTAPPPPPPTMLKVSFPAELWAAVEMAATANDATPQAIVLHVVWWVLRHEMATVKRGGKGTTAAAPAE